MRSEEGRDIRLYRESLVKNLVVVTGLSRSGKTMLAPIISSLERAENVQFNYVMEQIMPLADLGLMPKDTARYLMRYAMNFMMYDTYIGRNVNFRPTDYSSIWNTRDHALYFRRLFSEDGNAVMRQIDDDNHLFVLMFHNALWHADVIFEAFPTVKMLNVTRHPVDVVYSWFIRKYGALDGYNHTRVGVTTIDHNSAAFPYYVVGEEDEYAGRSEVDRIIYMVQKISEMHVNKYDALPREQKKQVMMIRFEQMVEKTRDMLSSICRFLNTTESLYTPIALHHERCPRIVDKTERAAKYEKLKGLASVEANVVLKSMIEKYEVELNL